MRENACLMGVANAFSAGVFMAIGFVHILAEANETLEDYFKKLDPNAEKIFPWAFFICIIR